MLLLLCAGLCLPLRAAGASSLEANRAASTSARQRVNEVRGQQMALRQELNQVAALIEQLKGAQKDPLAAAPGLDGALKRSQELSSSLTGLAQALSFAETDATREHLSLLGGLSSELSRLRADFDRVADRVTRKKLIAQMRALRAEREQVRAALPAASVPALEQPPPSDDPEDLLEQADAAKDSEDKVRRELQALEGRIFEVREERAFDRRLNEFLGDESIFDDQDRRFRLEKRTTETITTTTPAPDSPPDTSPSGRAREEPSIEATAAPGGLGNFEAPSFDTQSAKSGSPSAPGAVETSIVTRSSRASDGRPSVGGRGPGVAGGEDEDLEALETRRARLKSLAEQLKLRAAELQGRAKSLH